MSARDWIIPAFWPNMRIFPSPSSTGCRMVLTTPYSPHVQMDVKEGTSQPGAMYALTSDKPVELMEVILQWD